MRFIARQPIFDLSQQVFGYELLFRQGEENVARIEDFEQAGRLTLDNSFLWGLDQLSNGKMAFVNCTRAMLTERLIELLPPERTVVEVLETISADTEVVEACRALRERGFVIALDDVSSFDEVQPYLGVVEMAKVDLRLTDAPTRRSLVWRLQKHAIVPLAEKVETPGEYREAVASGFELFQGFYFQKPELMRTRDIPTLQANSLRLLKTAADESVDFELIAEAVREEPSLCFRLLRYLNSPLFGFAFAITDVGHALQLLGEAEIRRWLLVTVTAAWGERKSPELVVWALTRARFCELATGTLASPIAGAFLLGLLSAFPALLETPMQTILKHLPVSPDLKDGLLGVPGYGSDLLRLMRTYEAGEWKTCAEAAARIGSNEERVTTAYVDAVQWSNRIAYPAEGSTPRPVFQP